MSDIRFLLVDSLLVRSVFFIIIVIIVSIITKYREIMVACVHVYIGLTARAQGTASVALLVHSSS